MIVPLSTVYLLVAGLFGVVAAGILAFGRTRPRAERRLIGVAVVPPLGMVLGYLAMAFGVGQVGGQQLSRSVGYTLVTFAVVYAMRSATGFSWRTFWLVVAVILTNTWMGNANAVLPDAVAGILTLLSVVVFLFAAYLLLRPVARRTTGATESQQLFYRKVRDIYLLGYGTLILVAFISTGGVGLLDAFTGTIAAAYADLVLAAGAGVFIALNASAAVAADGSEQPSPAPAAAADD